MDVDSTLIQDEVIELLAAHAGRAAEVAAVTERAMRGELDFARACTSACPARRAARHGAGRRPRRRAAHARAPGRCAGPCAASGSRVALVSGGFIEVVAPLAAELGIEHVAGERLEVVDGRLTGRVAATVVDRAGKAAALRRFAAPRRCRCAGRSPSATAPTTSTCSPRPAWASRSTPSPSCASRPTPRSTCPTSTPCSTCSASPARRSRTADAEGGTRPPLLSSPRGTVNDSRATAGAAAGRPRRRAKRQHGDRRRRERSASASSARRSEPPDRPVAARSTLVGRVRGRRRRACARRRASAAARSTTSSASAV